VSCHNDCIRPAVGLLAAGLLLALSSLAASEERVLFDTTGLVETHFLDSTSNCMKSDAGNVAVTLGPLPAASYFHPSEWKHELLSDAHRITHVIAGVTTSICLLATSITLLLILRKSRSPSISSLLKLLCVLLTVNGLACLFHVITIWWPLNHLDALIRASAAIISVVIVGILVWGLPRAISFHGRASLRTAENELRLSKERFERALQGSSNGLWEWNIADGEAWFAPRFRELLGYTEIEFPNELASWENALHPDDKQATLTALEQYPENDDVFDVEYRLLTKSGEYRWFHARGVAIRSPCGDPYLMAGSIQDIHARKQAQENLRDRDEQLRHAQKLEAVGTLAGGIAHEFNNLLQAIQGYTIYAMEGLEQSSQSHQDLEQVLIASKRAASLTKQLLGFSRRQVLKLQPVDIKSLLEDLVKLIRPLIGENVKIELELDPESRSINADAGQIQQLIMNLCINARDAMSSDGILRIKSKPLTFTDTIHKSFPTLSSGRYVAISVSDSGCGIAHDLKPHIFEPFFTTKGVGRGTGLGLAMAYGIVQQHQGAIHVDSQVDVGTTFTVYLPSCEHCSVARYCDSPAAQYNGTETILIAEDDAIVRNLAVRTLHQAGYDTVTAIDGEEAVTVFRDNQRISLVLLDVMMPNMNGHDALIRIRSFRPDVPAIMCTGYDPETMAADHDLPEDVRMIQKPFDPSELLKTVRASLEMELCSSS
jgi:PAS domain S-box-containing protein